MNGGVTGRKPKRKQKHGDGADRAEPWQYALETSEISFHLKPNSVWNSVLWQQLCTDTGSSCFFARILWQKRLLGFDSGMISVWVSSDDGKIENKDKITKKEQNVL